MNDKRRKALNKIWHRMQALNEQLSGLKSTADELHTDLDAIKDEEQEAFDNLSESLQAGERGQAMERAVELMETALALLENVKDLEDLDEGLEALDNAEHGN